MGTTYSVAIKSHDVDSDFLKKEFESILAKINHEMSTYKEESLISKFNSDSSKKNFQLSFDFSYVIEKSFFYNDLSNGLFDITIHPLYDLWGFQSKSLDSIEPTSNQVLNILEFVGMDNLNFDASKMILSKVNPKTSIDLSAIAKGYAVDLIANYLEDLGYESFLVDIGGELRVASFDKTFWEIGIQKPDINEIGSVSEVINLRNKNANYYDKQLKNLNPHVVIPERPKGYLETYALYMVLCEKRDKLLKFLSKNNIDCKIHYPIPLHLQKASKKYGYREGMFPISEDQAKRLLTIPVHQFLNKGQLNHVVNSITEFYS